jgi:hypothetical protein
MDRVIGWSAIMCRSLECVKLVSGANWSMALNFGSLAAKWEAMNPPLDSPAMPILLGSMRFSSIPYCRASKAFSKKGVSMSMSFAMSGEGICHFHGQVSRAKKSGSDCLPGIEWVG